MGTDMGMASPWIIFILSSHLRPQAQRGSREQSYSCHGNDQARDG